jgi:hypothetical protein
VSKQHPQNGPSLNKSSKKQKPITDEERSAWEARKEAELEQTKRNAEKYKRIRKDAQSFVRGIIEKRSPKK